MNTFQIVALVILAVILIAAIVFYALAISKQYYPVYAHVIFWLSWVTVGTIATINFLH